MRQLQENTIEHRSLLQWLTMPMVCAICLMTHSVVMGQSEFFDADHGLSTAEHSVLEGSGPVRPVSFEQKPAATILQVPQQTQKLKPVPLPEIIGNEPLSPGFADPVQDIDAQRRANKFVLDRIEPQLTMDLQLGRPIILRLKQAPVRDQVSNPEVLDILTLDKTEFSLVGNKVGSTVLNYWFDSPMHNGEMECISYLVRVYDDPEEFDRYRDLLSQLEKDLNRTFPNGFVKLSYVGKKVVVRGQAKDIQEANSILQIVEASLPTQLAADLPPLVEVETTATSRVEREIPRYDEENFSNQTPTNSAIRRQGNRIVNLLEVGGIHQVMLKVTVAEVNRSAIRAIGADLRIGGTTSSFFSLLPIAQLGAAGTGGTLLVNRGDFDLAINALKQINLARSLAEPNLVTLNGQTANFQVGGEFPVPQVTGFTGAGLQGVEFVPFGVQLQFTPNVTDGDRIRLNLNATVSTRTEDTTNINGANVTGLNSRNFQSTVELREGQTIAMAGLIQTNLGATSERVPLVGDVPYLGRVFSSDQTSYDEQELIVLVTPYLVNPIDAESEPLPLPGSDYFEPDDLEFFLRGSLTSRFAEDFRTPARTDSHQIKAFRRNEQEMIIGQPGHSNGLLCPAVPTKVHP